jgi:predicted XRE-type DNA-binding protein
MSRDIAPSSGNVFADLGFSPEEAAILQMRADLMADLRKFITSRISDLARGKWERFSLEMLITLATRAGMRVSLKTAA